MDSKNKEMRVHLILALLAMSIIMALGLGKAKAAEKEVTLYVYYEGDEALHINIWNWTGIKVADGAAYSNVDFGDWNKDMAELTESSDFENWYTVKLVALDSTVDDGFDVYAGSEKIANGSLQYDGKEAYAKIVDDESTEVAIKDWALTDVPVKDNSDDNNNNNNNDDNNNNNNNDDNNNNNDDNNNNNNDDNNNNNNDDNNNNNNDDNNNNNNDDNNNNNNDDNNNNNNDDNNNNNTDDNNNEDGVFTLYVYNAKGGKTYLNVWNWKGLAAADGTEYEDPFNWGKGIPVMQPVEGKTGWYSVKLKILDATAEDGIDVYGATEAENILKTDNKWNNSPEIYAELVSGKKTAYAVKDWKLTELPADNDKNVKTGDETDILFLAGLMLVSGLAFICLSGKKEA